MKCIFPTELGIFESHRHKIPLAVLEATGARMPPLPSNRFPPNATFSGPKGWKSQGDKSKQ